MFFCYILFLIGPVIPITAQVRRPFRSFSISGKVEKQIHGSIEAILPQEYVCVRGTWLA